MLVARVTTIVIDETDWRAAPREERMKFNRWTVVAAAIFALLAADAFAQLGSIRGKILDEDGNPVDGVECSIEPSGGSGRRTSAKTKGDGQFTIGGVRPGTYTVICEKEGYRELPLQTRVSAFDQANLGEQVMFKLQPGELSEEQHARATELLAGFDGATASGDQQETLDKLFELKEMMPDSTEIDFNIAATYDQMNEAEKAIEYYTIAAERNPDLAYDSHLAVADLHGKAKVWADAAGALKKATDIRATDSVAMFNYAVYSQNAGDADNALTAYEKTLELDANRPMAHYQAGLILVGKAENERALAHFEQFLALAPDHPQAAAAREVVTALNAEANR